MTSAYFTFSSQMRPSLHQFRVYGPKNGLMLDHDQETLIKLRGARFVSYAENVHASDHRCKTVSWQRQNKCADILGSRFPHEVRNEVPDRVFLPVIVEHTAAPIPYREILLTAKSWTTFLFN